MPKTGMAPSPEPASGTSTPRSFAHQSSTAEDLLKSQTVGLVNLADFRKRRADALEQKEKEASDRSLGRFKSTLSGATTPDVESSDGALTPRDGLTGKPAKKKKKIAKGPLSFGDEDDADTASAETSQLARQPSENAIEFKVDKSKAGSVPRRLAPNPNLAIPRPTVITKASLEADAVTRESLRKEFLALQETVKNTEILVPFVFYDGTHIPGGKVKLKKGDHIWLFLDRCRKVGAELGVSGSGNANGLSQNKNDSRRQWARVGVDDLLCVRGDVIVPHHFEFYYFIANRVKNPSNQDQLLFDYVNTSPPAAINAYEAPSLRKPANDDLEGYDHDPSLTKVVDRRWYLRNKHIYPASLWKEYEMGKEFEEKMSKSRRDAQGNAFFFS